MTEQGVNDSVTFQTYEVTERPFNDFPTDASLISIEPVESSQRYYVHTLKCGTLDIKVCVTMKGPPEDLPPDSQGSPPEDLPPQIVSPEHPRDVQVTVKNDQTIESGNENNLLNVR